MYGLYFIQWRTVMLLTLKILLPDYFMILTRQNFQCEKTARKRRKTFVFVFDYILISTKSFETVVDKRHSIYLKTTNCVMLGNKNNYGKHHYL